MLQRFKLIVVLMSAIFFYTSMPVKANVIETIGDVGQFALPISALLATIFHRDKTGTIQLAESYGTTMAVVYILKPTVDRTRPNGGKWSFPSGHSASAFSGAAFMQMRYGWAYGIPAYMFAGFVGYSRVEAKKHWTTDVLGGAAIGILANLIFTRRYRNVELGATTEPGGGVGVALQARFQ